MLVDDSDEIRRWIGGSVGDEYLSWVIDFELLNSTDVCLGVRYLT